MKQRLSKLVRSYARSKTLFLMLALMFWIRIMTESYLQLRFANSFWDKIARILIKKTAKILSSISVEKEIKS